MLLGKKVGIISAITGISIGLFYAVSPVIYNLSNGLMSGHEAGLQSAVIATVAGLSFAAIAIISNLTDHPH